MKNAKHSGEFNEYIRAKVYNSRLYLVFLREYSGLAW